MHHNASFPGVVLLSTPEIFLEGLACFLHTLPHRETEQPLLHQWHHTHHSIARHQQGRRQVKQSGVDSMGGVGRGVTNWAISPLAAHFERCQIQPIFPPSVTFARCSFHAILTFSTVKTVITCF